MLTGDNQVLSISGVYGATKTYTMTSDTAVTIQAAYVAGGGTWNKTIGEGSFPPIGVLVVCETNACRFALGGTTPTVDDVGMPVAALGSFQISGPGAADGMKITNSTAGSNAVLHITPIYQG